LKSGIPEEVRLCSFANSKFIEPMQTELWGVLEETAEEFEEDEEEEDDEDEEEGDAEEEAEEVQESVEFETGILNS